MVIIVITAIHVAYIWQPITLWVYSLLITSLWHIFNLLLLKTCVKYSPSIVWVVVFPFRCSFIFCNQRQKVTLMIFLNYYLCFNRQIISLYNYFLCCIISFLVIYFNLILFYFTLLTPSHFIHLQSHAKF